MSYVAKLFVFGQEREVVNAAITYHRLVNNQTGKAGYEPQGGLIDLEMLSSYDDDILARWIINEPEDKLCILTKGVLVFYKESFGNPPAFTYKFNDAALIKYSEVFSAQDDTPMTLKMTISPAIQEYKEQTVVKHWQENWVPPSEKEPYQSPVIEDKRPKKCIIKFKADSDDIREGNFGFDAIPNKYKNLLEDSSKAIDFENEYDPIEVENERYFPPWISIRKGQTIILELDKSLRHEEEYKEVKFEEHPDFTFEPIDRKDKSTPLIEAKKVRITCHNHNAATAQIKVLADGKNAGAINFWYPHPKSIKLEWCFVEITGEDEDFNDLRSFISYNKIMDVLKKGFNASLIDITPINKIAKTVNLSEKKTYLKEENIIKEFGRDSYIENKYKKVFISEVEKKIDINKNIITLLLVNRKCLITGARGENGDSFKAVAGFSYTGTGVAYGILDPSGRLISSNIIHELMHSLGLTHTFSDRAKYKMKPKKTKNYMDYNTIKKTTFKYQWEQLYNYSKLK